MLLYALVPELESSANPALGVEAWMPLYAHSSDADGRDTVEGLYI